MQPHAIDGAVGERNAHVAQPPRRALSRLCLHAAYSVRLHVDPDVAAQQRLVLAFGAELDDIATVAIEGLFTG